MVSAEGGRASSAKWFEAMSCERAGGILIEEEPNLNIGGALLWNSPRTRVLGFMPGDLSPQLCHDTCCKGQQGNFPETHLVLRRTE